MASARSCCNSWIPSRPPHRPTSFSEYHFKISQVAPSHCIARLGCQRRLADICNVRNAKRCKGCLRSKRGAVMASKTPPPSLDRCARAVFLCSSNGSPIQITYTNGIQFSCLSCRKPEAANIGIRSEVEAPFRCFLGELVYRFEDENFAGVHVALLHAFPKLRRGTVLSILSSKSSHRLVVCGHL